MAIKKAPTKLSGPAEAEFDEFDKEIELIQLSKEIEMRQANINKLGAILGKAKDTVREAQSRVDYEHLRLHQAAERQKELHGDK